MQNQLMMLGQFKKIITLLLIILYSIIIFLSSHRIITEFPLNGYGAVRTSWYRKVNYFDDPTPGSHSEHQEPPTPNSKPPNHHPRRADYPTQQKHARFFCRVRVHIGFLLGSEKPQNYFEIHLRMWQYLLFCCLTHNCLTYNLLS